MKYRLVYTPRAEKDIRGLDPNSSLGSYRFRIGDFRVIFDIEKDEIVVLRVGHRREIYRKGSLP